MPAKRSQTAQRRHRTGAQRNRERILEVAKEAFARSGANTSLDDVAKLAGVGAGTLYRHFTTRDALLEAVYRTEVEKLAAAERKFAQTMPPIEALRGWMLLFVDYIAAKQIITPALNALVGALRNCIKLPATCCLQRGVQPGLATKRQETGGYPHRRFAADHLA